MKKNMLRLIVMLCLLPLSATVLAHTGHDHGGSSLISGLLHPLTGLDHLIVMLAIGLWAVSSTADQTVRPALRSVQIFLPIMLTGAVLAMAGIKLPAIETGIAASLLVMGLLLFSMVKVSRVFSVSLISLFALIHGYAHGLEMPLKADPVLYTGGFLLMTMVLQLSGARLGRLIQQVQMKWLCRAAGVLASGAGAWLLVS